MRPLHGQFSQGEPPAATPAVTSCLTNVGLTHDFLSLRGSRQYADPVSDLLDKWGAFRCRLFRESCVFHRGNYVKDLSRLGRDLSKVIIVDNSPASYVFHPDNAVSIPPADSHTVAFLPFSSSVCEFSGFFCLFVCFFPPSAAGSRGLVVRRHVRHGAAGPHPVLREAEQSGQRLRGPQAPGGGQLTAFDL